MEKVIITEKDILKADNLTRVRYLIQIIKGQIVFIETFGREQK